MRALLDVNVLIALLDDQHLHHAIAKRWFVEHLELGWATCPLSQNGCARILSQPAYSNAISTVRALEKIAHACKQAEHEFWPDSISLVDPKIARVEQIHGPRQLTDIYLLALAVNRRGRLVTLDERIPLSAVQGAKPEHLVVI